MSLSLATSIYDKLNNIVRELLKEEEKATILVDENIGAGKSTFLENYFEGRPHCTIIYEHLEKFCNFRGQNMLENYYDRPLKYSENIQSLIPNLNLKQMLKTDPTALKIMERSVFSAFNIFTTNLKDNRYLTPVQYNVLEEWYNFSVQMLKTCHLLPKYKIYLRSSPEFCLKQIKQRNRPEEQEITLEYLQQIHDKHEELFEVDGTPAVRHEIFNFAREFNFEGMEETDINELLTSHNKELSNEELLQLELQLCY